MCGCGNSHSVGNETWHPQKRTFESKHVILRIHFTQPYIHENFFCYEAKPKTKLKPSHGRNPRIPNLIKPWGF